MATRTHRYATRLTWTGNRGTGTSGYRDYDRTHEIAGVPAGAKPPIPGSADPAFRGDAARWNPEDLLIASISACHQLWYLHLCADAGIPVLAYEDEAEGELEESGAAGGRFVRATLRPRVTIARGADVARARALHAQAHALCFVANSVNFPVSHEAEVTEGD
jgi:organic hydroperoxide reductase OsmC/OhrA